jgi:SpoIID/LytB domain protein
MSVRESGLLPALLALTVLLPFHVYGADVENRDRVNRPHIEFTDGGIPIVGLGIRIGVPQVTFHAKTPFVLHTGDATATAKAKLPKGRYRVRIENFEEGEYHHFLVVDSFPYSSSSDRVSKRLDVWKKRGFDHAMIQTTGVVLGLDGEVFDARKKLIVIGGDISTEELSEAEKLLRSKYDQKLKHRRLVQQSPSGRLVFESLNSPHRFQIENLFRVRGQQNRAPIFEVESVPKAYEDGVESMTLTGELVFRPEPGGGLTAINRISVEDILKGVVPAEIYASAPKEALKAQAVAARTNIFESLIGTTSSTSYLMRADVGDQVYKGINREDPRTSRAVESTTGEVLSNGEHIVSAPYSSNAGGYTENVQAVWDIEQKPHLKGRLDVSSDHRIPDWLTDGVETGEVERFLSSDIETFSSISPLPSSSYYRWRERLSRKRLIASFREAGYQLERIQSIDVLSRGVSGRANKLRLESKQSLFTIKGELQIRRILGGLPSSLFVFDVHRGSDKRVSHVTFRGAGFGHGVGMCQTGAAGMADQGASYREILGHYYRGTELMALYGAKR